MMNFLGFLVLLALAYTVGLDAVMGTLDSVDTHLRAAYSAAVKAHPDRWHREHAQELAELEAKREHARRARHGR